MSGVFAAAAAGSDVAQDVDAMVLLTAIPDATIAANGAQTSIRLK